MKDTKLLLLALICMVMSHSLYSSSPVKNRYMKLTQPDGTIVPVFITGDASVYHNNIRIHDENDYTIIRDDNTGVYCWAKQGKDGWLESTGYAIHRSHPEKLGLQPGENISAERRQERREEWMRKRDAAEARRKKGN